MYKYQHRELPSQKNFWTILVVSNTQRYRSRYALFERCEKHIAKGSNYVIVEHALGDRPHEMSALPDGLNRTPQSPIVVHVRSRDELWHKENLINIGIRALPPSWEYCAWIDADVQFARPDWAEETVHQLQHFDVVQMFASAIDLGPEGQTLKTYDGFMSAWQGDRMKATQRYAAAFHPGFAWAARREAIEHLGGLIDWAILGSGDRHMACALIGRVLDMPKMICSEDYREHLLRWEDNAQTHLRRNVGHVPGTLLHNFHGAKASRQYENRWDILRRHHFEPTRDIKRDWQGLWQFTHIGARMRNDIRSYFAQRNEDGLTV